MKNAIAILLAFVMLFSLAACGGAENEEKAKDNISTEGKTSENTSSDSNTIDDNYIIGDWVRTRIATKSNERSGYVKEGDTTEYVLSIYEGGTAIQRWYNRSNNDKLLKTEAYEWTQSGNTLNLIMAGMPTGYEIDYRSNIIRCLADETVVYQKMDN